MELSVPNVSLLRTAVSGSNERGTGQFLSSGSLGGYCELPGDCLCRDGYFGDSCSESTSHSSALVSCLSLSLGDHVCLNQTCSGNGTCRANDTSPFYSCDCEDGYLGDDCQFMEELVSCDPQCQNGDDCVVSIGMCPAGSVEDHMHQLSLLKFLVMLISEFSLCGVDCQLIHTFTSQCNHHMPLSLDNSDG